MLPEPALLTASDWPAGSDPPGAAANVRLAGATESTGPDVSLNQPHPLEHG